MQYVYIYLIFCHKNKEPNLILENNLEGKNVDSYRIMQTSHLKKFLETRQLTVYSETCTWLHNDKKVRGQAQALKHRINRPFFARQKPCRVLPCSLSIPSFSRVLPTMHCLLHLTLLGARTGVQSTALKYSYSLFLANRLSDLFEFSGKLMTGLVFLHEAVHTCISTVSAHLTD